MGLLLVPALAFAQKSVKGTVTDESGEPLVGVTVQVAGTDEYAVTDLDGQYTVLAKDGDKLIVSFIGMKTREVKGKALAGFGGYTWAPNVVQKALDDFAASVGIPMLGFVNMKQSIDADVREQAFRLGLNLADKCR